MNSYNMILNRVIKREGGYVNHPADKGGPTNFGITIKTLSQYLGRPASVDEVKNLKVEVAKDIYSKYYLEPFLKYTENPQLLDLVVDCAVHHGVSRTNTWMVELTSESLDPNVLYRLLLIKRIKFFGTIITNNPSQAVFANGWMNRVAEFVR